MTFRIIPNQKLTAAQNMAYDEACMTAIKEGEAGPTIRIYEWEPAAVSIGYFQCLTDEVDVEACKKANVPIVRRQTGGGAVYHDKELTYSIIAPEEHFSKNIAKSYEEICTPVIEALERCGVKATFRPINDILAAGKKISGNAQVRKQGILLQHGTILLEVEPDKMFTYLTPDKSKLSDKPYIKSVRSAVTSAKEQHAASKEALAAALRKAFAEHYTSKPGPWTEYEQDLMTRLAVEKYSSESWNAMR